MEIFILPSTTPHDSSIRTVSVKSMAVEFFDWSMAVMLFGVVLPGSEIESLDVIADNRVIIW